MSATNTSIDRIIAASNAITDDDGQDTAAPDTQHAPHAPYASKTVTKEERERLEEIWQAINGYQAEIDEHYKKGESTAAGFMSLADEVAEKYGMDAIGIELEQIQNTVIQRYVKAAGENYKTIMQDLTGTLNRFTEGDVESFAYWMGYLFIGRAPLAVDDVSVYLAALKAIKASDKEAKEAIDAVTRKYEIDIEAFERAADIETYASRYSNDFLYLRDRVSQAAWRAGLTNTPTRLTTGTTYPNQKKAPAFVTASIKFDEMKQDASIQISGASELTAFDEDVHNAIVTLCIEGGNDVFNAQMIWRQMTGNKRAEASTHDVVRIMESVHKMRFTNVRIDTTGERDKYPNLDLIYDAYLLNIEMLRQVTINGTIVANCMKLFNTPPLYRYAAGKKHISRIPMSLLNNPFRTTPEQQATDSYLLKRIDMIKGNARDKGIITYQGIYDAVGIDDADPSARVKKKRARDRVKDSLQFYVDQKHIISFRDNPKKGRTITSLTVEVEKTEQPTQTKKRKTKERDK